MMCDVWFLVVDGVTMGDGRPQHLPLLLQQQQQHQQQNHPHSQQPHPASRSVVWLSFNYYFALQLSADRRLGS